MAAPRKTAAKKAAPKKTATKPLAKAAEAKPESTKKSRPIPEAFKAQQWKPGQSGNPGGRSPIIRELRDVAREHTVTALETLIGVMTNTEAPAAARVAAAAHMLDRGYGKPTQNINAAVRNAQKMTDDELIAFLTGVDQEGGGDGASEAERGSGFAH